MLGCHFTPKFPNPRTLVQQLGRAGCGRRAGRPAGILCYLQLPVVLDLEEGRLEHHGGTADGGDEDHHPVQIGDQPEQVTAGGRQPHGQPAGLGRAG